MILGGPARVWGPPGGPNPRRVTKNSASSCQGCNSATLSFRFQFLRACFPDHPALQNQHLDFAPICIRRLHDHRLPTTPSAKPQHCAWIFAHFWAGAHFEAGRYDLQDIAQNLVQICIGMLQGHREAAHSSKTISKTVALCSDFRIGLCERSL